MQAVDYSAAMLYLMVVKAIGIDDGDKIMAQMRNTKCNDMYTTNAYRDLRPETDVWCMTWSVLY